jgi:hypothetical protein
MKKGMAWPVRIDHFDIRRHDMNPLLFGLDSLYKVFRSRRKKKLEVIIAENRVLGSVLNTLKVLHGSEVLVNPDRRTLADLLNAMSHAS